MPEATIHEHYRSIERGLHVDDLLSVVGALDDDAPLVLFGSCGGAVTAVRAAERRAASCAPSSPTRCRSC